MSRAEHPEIEALRTSLAEHDLRLVVVPAEDALEARSWRRVQVRGADGLELNVPVDDEYGDARGGNPAMLLHLVLATCEVAEEQADFEAWATEAEIDASAPWARGLYDELEVCATRLRDAVGPELRALSSWDMSMNAGAAQALRKL